MRVLKIKDETTTGDIINEIELAIENEKITIRDLIFQRVFSEVNKYNNSKKEIFRGLIQPNESEIALNGFKPKKRKQIDAEKQAFIALDAFTKNGFFLLIDDIQKTDLDEEVLVSHNTKVSFIKLTPLVGG